MGFGKKVLIYMQENVVLLSGAAIIVATHWGWSKLQENPALVPENEKKDLPVIIGARYLEKKVKEELAHLSNPSAAPEETKAKQ